MKLEPELLKEYETIPWFSMAGMDGSPNFNFSVQFIKSREEALQSFNSDVWDRVKNEASGDLTEYLHRHYLNSYAGHWNKLAKEMHAYVMHAATPNLLSQMHAKQLPPAMLDLILLDLVDAGMETTYRKHFRKIPVFFEKVLEIYRNGRLPCGWAGDPKQWPVGTLLAY
jgi:hypothetical protein